MEVDPEDLEDGAGDDERVEAVEGGAEEVGHAQRVHPDPHLEDEGRQEQELGVVCNKRVRNKWPGCFSGPKLLRTVMQRFAPPPRVHNFFTSHISIMQQQDPSLSNVLNPLEDNGGKMKPHFSPDS